VSQGAIPGPSSNQTIEDQFETVVALAAADITAGWTAPLTIATVCLANSDLWVSLCREARANHDAYARRHRYGLRFHSQSLSVGREPSWWKLPILASVLRVPAVRFAFWMDSDSLFMRQATPLDAVLPPSGKSSAWPADALVSVSAGHSMMRASASAEALLRAAWALWPPPHPRIWWEQSALVYLLGGEQSACRVDVLCNKCSAMFSGQPQSACAGHNCSRRLGGRWSESAHVFPAGYMVQDLKAFAANGQSGLVLHFAGEGSQKAQFMSEFARLAEQPAWRERSRFVPADPSSVTRPDYGATNCGTPL